MAAPQAPSQQKQRLPPEIWQKVISLVAEDVKSPANPHYKAIAELMGINTNTRQAVKTMPEYITIKEKGALFNSFERAVYATTIQLHAQTLVVNTTFENVLYRLTVTKTRDNSQAIISQIYVKQTSPVIELLYPDDEFPSPSKPDPLSCNYIRRPELMVQNKQSLEILLERCLWFIRIACERFKNEHQVIVQNTTNFKDRFSVRMCELPILNRP